MQQEITGAALPSVAALAYVGDARHSLFVRKMLVEQGITKSGELNKRALLYVTAEAQSAAYRIIEPELNELERDVFRRAHNSTHLNKPRHASGKEYREATGFEAVIGMLHWLGNEERVEALLKMATENMMKTNGGNINDTED
jgi:ribonuclease-3 family protein